VEVNSRAQGDDRPKKGKRIGRGIRCEESVWTGLEAVRQQDGDETINDTACKAFREYIRARLAA
jgi:hypothetical protein